MFQRTLWAFIAGAAALCSVLGWVAVRRGLAPLRTMRGQTSGVTATNYRLPLERLPRELIELARSLNAMLAVWKTPLRLTAFSSADFAHELRTPVSSTMTETQVALSRAAPRDYLRVLESNA